MASEEKNTIWRHQISLVEREELTVDGVVSLGSYDEQNVTLDTEEGPLLIKGEGLHITQLNLEKGHIVVAGLVASLQYEQQSGGRRGLLGRIFR